MNKPTHDIPADAFTPSTAQMPPVDERADLVSILNADCAKLTAMAWDLRKVYADYTAKRTEVEGAIAEGEKPELTALLAACAKFNGLEKDLLALRESIETRAAAWNYGRDLNERICISHTEEGLPIRVNSKRRVPLWGI